MDSDIGKRDAICMSLIQAILLAVVEGLTEYLPISSTGHLIITSWFLGINDQPFTKDFTVIVQFGAILSVLVLYWRRFVTSIDIYLKLMVAFLPAAVIGLLVKNKIDALLGDVVVVAVALIIGGVVLLFIDRLFAKQEEQLALSKQGSIDDLSPGRALIIGLLQCLAFIPGVSRAAATIVGGLFVRLDRKSAAEFSFLLAVPTLTAASLLKLYKLMKTPDGLNSEHLNIIIIGNVISFIVGAITIKAFLHFLEKRGFLAFGLYRIIVGILILILVAAGHQLKAI